MPAMASNRGRRVIIEPAEEDAKLYERDGRLLLYIGKVTVNDHAVKVVPCRGITEGELQILKWAWLSAPISEDHWRHGPDGWTTHVSVPVDVDDAIAHLLGCADEVERWAAR
jgi:hypothetical protein